MSRHPKLIKGTRTWRGGAVYTGSTTYVPPKRQTVAIINVVPCPDCGAALGENCVSTGGRATGAHVSRRRMALRKQREQESES